MARTCDVIIAGLGAMGSAAAWHLAEAGQRVLGFDRFAPPHTLGSSHGRTRIIREAYFEHPAYVPIVQRAYALWTDLERRAPQRLLLQTGGLMVGTPETAIVRGARRSAEVHGLPHESLSAREVRARFPALRPDEGMVAVWERRAGILFPEACVAAQLDRAAAAGATLHINEPVERWSIAGDGLRVQTARGAYEAGRLVVAAGAWASRLLPDLPVPLTVERQVLHWFRPAAAPESFRPGACPVQVWETAAGEYFYGFPDTGDGVKVGRHHGGEVTTPDSVRRDVGPDEVAAMRALLARYLPDASGPAIESAVCLYTNTPDEHFLVDALPAAPQVVVASPCSGHGFKFASAIGELVRDLVVGREPQVDARLFRFDRGR